MTLVASPEVLTDWFLVHHIRASSSRDITQAHAEAQKEQWRMTIEGSTRELLSEHVEMDKRIILHSSSQMDIGLSQSFFHTICVVVNPTTCD